MEKRAACEPKKEKKKQGNERKWISRQIVSQNLSNLSSFPSSLLRSKTFSTGRTIFLPFVLSFSISSPFSFSFLLLSLFLLLFHPAIHVIDAAFTNHLRRKIQASQHVFPLFSLLCSLCPSSSLFL